MSPLLLIPARMASTRLPGKPLAEIAGEAMIVQCWRRAMESGVGRVAVACDGEAIAQAVREAGGEAVLTDPDHPSGSDRIYEALNRLDPEKKHDVIINLQGDLPTLDPALVKHVLAPLADAAIDIATLAAVITREDEKTDPSVVKVVMAPLSKGASIASSESPPPTLVGTKDCTPSVRRSPSKGSLSLPIQSYRALYFTRATAPGGEGPLYHHIGIYAYRRAALERFVTLPQGELERREKLEQLRALEHGMTIGVALVDTVPLGVDTQAQLEEARMTLADRKR